MYSRLIICASAAMPIAKAAPHFTETQIVLSGNLNFDITGINDSGTMVGELYAPITDTPSGIMMKRRFVTTLQPPYGAGPAYPTSIYNDGTIIGYEDLSITNPGGGLTETFVLRNNAVVPRYRYQLDVGVSSGPRLGVNTIGLAGSQIFFTRVISRTLPNIGEYGTPPNLQMVPKIEQFNTIKGLSAAGVVSGQSFSEYVRGKVFQGSGKDFHVLAPEGAISSSGGYANKAGKVAGSYFDSTNEPHGFVYDAGNYTTFDMPKPASSVTVTAINDLGWVVGFYTTSADDSQHVFVYNGSAVTSIGNYDFTAGLAVALNNVGQVVISEQFQDFTATKFLSFLETCHKGSC